MKVPTDEEISALKEHLFRLSCGIDYLEAERKAAVDRENTLFQSRIAPLRGALDQFVHQWMNGDTRYGTKVTFKHECAMGGTAPVVPAGTRGMFLGLGADSGGCTHIIYLLDGPEEVRDYYNRRGFWAHPSEIVFDDPKEE